LAGTPGPKFGSPANSRAVVSLRGVEDAGSRAKPARPYMVRFNILSRFICPSAGLVVQGKSRVIPHWSNL
jgi:hypothetical protein